MSICEIFPDDPTCAAPVVEEPVEEVVPADDAVEADAEGAMEEGEAMEGEDMEGEGKMDEKPMGWGMTEKFIGYQAVSGLHMFEAQLGMFVGAASVAAYNAVYKFRYTDSKSFDKAVITDGTNFNQLADDVLRYGSIAICGTAALTQLASLAGIAVDINLMVWNYGIFMGMPALTGLGWML